MSLFCRGSQAPLEALRCRFAPDSPDSGIAGLRVNRIYAGFHSSGGLTQGMPPANSFPLTLSWQWHVIESDRTEFSPSREKERVVAVVELPAILGASGSKSQGGVQ